MKDVPMSEGAQRWDSIIAAVFVALLVVGFAWHRDNSSRIWGPCVRLSDANSVTAVYYLRGDPTFATYTSADCTAESRISI